LHFVRSLTQLKFAVEDWEVQVFESLSTRKKNRSSARSCSIRELGTYWTRGVVGLNSNSRIQAQWCIEEIERSVWCITEFKKNNQRSFIELGTVVKTSKLLVQTSGR
jgi:hypothetical protein